MSSSDQKHEIKCAFCGKIHSFSSNELYETNQENEKKIIQKFCIECGEPLVKYCPNCDTGIFLYPNLQENKEFKIDKTFNEPTPSDLDELLPKIKNKFDEFKKNAAKLNPDVFRTQQPQYLEYNEIALEHLKELNTMVDEIYKVSQKIPSLDIEDLVKDVTKDIQKSLDRCRDVKESIIEEKGFVEDKIHKKLMKKPLKVLFWEEDFVAFWDYIREFRDKEIKEELDSYKPGMERVKNYLLFNPNDYRFVCPRCKTKVYSIEKNDFVFGKKNKDYEDTYNLTDMIDTEDIPEEEEFSDTFSFNILINVSKPGGDKYQINGKMKFVLNEGEEKVVGRNYIREIPYQEPIADEILFNSEDDILKMVSRTQMSFYQENNILKAKGMEYDSRRIGTYYNDMSNDIRQIYPDGQKFKKGDTIIIPITGEENNENRIEITRVK